MSKAKISLANSNQQNFARRIVWQENLKNNLENSVTSQNWQNPNENSTNKNSEFYKSEREMENESSQKVVFGNLELTYPQNWQTLNKLKNNYLKNDLENSQNKFKNKSTLVNNSADNSANFGSKNSNFSQKSEQNQNFQIFQSSKLSQNSLELSSLSSNLSESWQGVQEKNLENTKTEFLISKNSPNYQENSVNNSQKQENLKVNLVKVENINSKNLDLIDSVLVDSEENSKNNLVELKDRLKELCGQKKVLENQISDLKFENWQAEQKLAKFVQKSDQNSQNWNVEKLEILKQRAFWQSQSRQKSEELTKLKNQIENLQKLTVATQMDKIYWQEQNLTWQSRWTFYTTKWLKQEEKWQENLAHNQREFVLQIKEMETRVLQKERIWLLTIAIIFGVLTIFCLSFFRI